MIIVNKNFGSNAIPVKSTGSAPRMAGYDDDETFWDGGAHAKLESTWRNWMSANEPAGGWRRATLTSGVAGGGLQFKHFGSLWRRSVQQWDLYLERGAVDIFEIEERLQSHPWVKPYSVESKTEKPGATNCNYKHNHPLAPKPYGPHESPHDLRLSC